MTAGAWPCVCGRRFAKRFGLNVHGRTCEIEAARSAAYVEGVQSGLRGADLDDYTSKAVAVALREREARL